MHAKSLTTSDVRAKLLCNYYFETEFTLK